jgi:hypothetical protein
MKDYDNRLTRLEHKRPIDHLSEEHRQAIIDAAFEPGMTEEEKEREMELMRQEREAYLRRYR